MAFRKILVVEDEPLMRASLVRMLTSLQVEIIAVGTVAEARRALTDGGVDLVITDVSLADGESGVEVARAAAGLRPAPP
ncbi:MAG: response regulator [Polyangiaceae bacterium]